ncbi:unnamed protein product [Eruca vesicaria subsp. sativa]|uniref:Uncharacterized protein n=1 Tax=Eruca vesicaria subsp. sativa TaxID=29727 RepID=A0ABC8LMF3_ERUVS|nr:unnamed protein product [Eruca vesicaria subsp. sativa]
MDSMYEIREESTWKDMIKAVVGMKKQLKKKGVEALKLRSSVVKEHWLGISPMIILRKDQKEKPGLGVGCRQYVRLVMWETVEVIKSNGGEEDLPSCLEKLTGKQFEFQIRPFNFTPNHHTFTVSTLTEDNTIENHGKNWEHRLRAICFGLKIGEEFAVEDPPEISDGQNKRKRGRE